MKAWFGKSGSPARGAGLGAILIACCAGAAYLPAFGDVPAASAKNHQFALCRLGENGVLDPAFGTHGLVVADFSAVPDDTLSATQDEGVTGLILDAEDKITAGGFALIDSFYQFAAARFHADGRIDSTFGSAGKVLVNFKSAAGEQALAATIDAENRVILAGRASIGGKDQIAIVRLKPDGTQDSTFNGDGKVLVNYASGSGEAATSVIVDHEGRIVAGGFAVIGDTMQFALVRVLPNGSMDASFERDGKVLMDFQANAEECVNGIAEDAEGRIAAAGYAVVGGRPQFAVARFLANGDPDSSFSGDGRMLANYSSGTGERANAAFFDASGNILAAGGAIIDGHQQFAAVRVLPAGSLDHAFDGDGKILTDFTNSDEEWAAAAGIDFRGRLVMAGTMSWHGPLVFAMARTLADGSLDTTFSKDGKQLVDFPDSDGETGTAAVLDAAGRLIVAGSAHLKAPVSAVCAEEATGPSACALAHNYPNPFNPSTTIRFRVAAPGNVRIEVLDASGRTVRILADERMEAGARSVSWDGADDGGRPVPSGIYVCRMTAGRTVRTMKMTALH
jgi:uncharacterized delta-60 repeat protein